MKRKRKKKTTVKPRLREPLDNEWGEKKKEEEQGRERKAGQNQRNAMRNKNKIKRGYVMLPTA